MLKARWTVVLEHVGRFLAPGSSSGPRRAKGVPFSTPRAMCRVLPCRAGDLGEWIEG